VAKIRVILWVDTDTDDYVLPMPDFADEPKGFVRELVKTWELHGLEDESYHYKWKALSAAAEPAPVEHNA
jgi:hypothetical protein